MKSLSGDTVTRHTVDFLRYARSLFSRNVAQYGDSNFAERTVPINAEPAVARLLRHGERPHLLICREEDTRDLA